MPLLPGFFAALLLAQTPPVQPAPRDRPRRRPAAPPEPADVPEVKEEVTVSATRTDRRLQDEPLRVEVIDREEIEEKALMTPGSVAMLLGETTGLRVQTVAPSLGAANVRIQGLRGRYAQLLADGLPLYGAGGDSLNLLQVPPLDLGQVEVIKGAASALYGPAALGGVINLVSRRPQEAETEALVNVTSQAGLDGTFWIGVGARRRLGWTLLTGFHGQRRQDLDDDGWSDLPAFARGVVRPRFRYESDTGAALFVTGGAIVEQRDGGTEPGALAPDGAPFAQDLDTRRADAGAVGRWVLGPAACSPSRGAYSRNGQAARFGDVVRARHAAHRVRRGARMTMPAGRHTLVVGAALQQDRFDLARPAALRLRLHGARGVRAGRDHAGLARRDLGQRARRRAQRVRHAGEPARLAAASSRPPEWTARLSVGGGAFAPTPFTEETDDSGLSRLAPLVGLEAERARTASADVTWTRGPFEISATVFGSIVDDAVQLATLAQIAVIGAPGLSRRPGQRAGADAHLGHRAPRRATGAAGFGLMATHAFTRATELDVDTGLRREVPLTPRHAASFNAAWEAGWGRAGFEAYYTGRQALDDDPYRDDRPRATCCSAASSSGASAASACSSTSRTSPTSARRRTRRSSCRRAAPTAAGRSTPGPRSTAASWNGGIRVAF